MAEAPGAPAKIIVLAVHEECGRKAAKPIPQDSFNQEANATDHVHRQFRFARQLGIA